MKPSADQYLENATQQPVNTSKLINQSKTGNSRPVMADQRLPFKHRPTLAIHNRQTLDIQTPTNACHSNADQRMPCGKNRPTLAIQTPTNACHANADQRLPFKHRPTLAIQTLAKRLPFKHRPTLAMQTPTNACHANTDQRCLSKGDVCACQTNSDRHLQIKKAGRSKLAINDRVFGVKVSNIGVDEIHKKRWDWGATQSTASGLSREILQRL